jgi:hypothetical protein
MQKRLSFDHPWKPGINTMHKICSGFANICKPDKNFAYLTKLIIICTNKCTYIHTHIHICSIKLYYKCSYIFRCLCTIFRDLIYRGADKSLARPDWKNNWNFAIFRPGRCCRGELVGPTTLWFVFEWLAKVRVWSL